MAIPLISIDHMVLTISIDPEQQKEVQRRMDHALTLFPNRLENKKPRGRYKNGYEFTVSPDTVINVEANPAREGYNYLKLSYSPANLGQCGTELLVNYLREIVGETYRNEFFGGRLQCITLSFNLQDVSLDDLLIERFRGRDKRIALILDADSDMNSVCVGYDSKRRLVFTQAACDSDEPCVRVEYIHDKGTYALSDFFDQLDNPLRSLTIRRYAPMPEMDGVQSRLLFDACRLGGRDRVLDMYPEDERENLKAAIMRGFPMVNESKLKLSLWAQLRGEIGALLPDSGDVVL